MQLRMEKAANTMEQVRGIVPMQYLEVIANRLYYAAYYAVSALIIANGDTAQTHSGVVRAFGLHFVKTGRVSNKLGSLYNKLYVMRLTGDYDDTHNLEEDEVLPFVDPTGELIEEINKLTIQVLQEKLGKSA